MCMYDITEEYDRIDEVVDMLIKIEIAFVWKFFIPVIHTCDLMFYWYESYAMLIAMKVFSHLLYNAILFIFSYVE